jgi:hypothetical protein
MPAHFLLIVSLVIESMSAAPPIFLDSEEAGGFLSRLGSQHRLTEPLSAMASDR